MKKMSSTYKLLIALGILAAIYFLLQLSDDGGRSKSFRSELVSIDTSSADKVLITNKSGTLEIFKDEGIWKIAKDGGTVKAQKLNVKRLFSDLLRIKPGRIAARDEDKWKDFGVDSAATRIRVFEDDSKTLDILLGRMDMKGQNQFFSYVRLSDESEVYTADGIMAANFSINSADYRNKQITRFTVDSVRSVDFNYPADSSFKLEKTMDQQWKIGSSSADSTVVADYLNSIRYLRGSIFDDSFSAENEATYAIEIERYSEDPIRIEIYSSESGTIVNSSSNEKAFFLDEERKISEKLLKGMSHFASGSEDTDR
jgi:hypothetical protein